jgi:hydrogenase-4 component B
MGIILFSIALIAASGVPSALAAWGGKGARKGAAWWGCAMLMAGAVGVLLRVFPVIMGGKTLSLGAISLPIGSFSLRIDALSGVFIAQILLVGVLGTIYGLRYYDPEKNPRAGAQVRLMYGFLVAGLCLVTAAADGVTFLMAWEAMSLSAFGAISAEDHRSGARQGGWLYLVNTHLSMLVLFAMFALFAVANHGSFALDPIAAGSVAPGMRAAIFLLALIGFGCKAGMMPTHFWLPDAHANAPSHVSALMSGVVIKMGIYGLVRVGLMLLPDPPLSWGIVVLVLGIISAILGVAFALGQHDLKRLLAYHSIENIGIILMGLGIALIGTYAHQPAWAAVGLAGCLLHVWNHGLFKSLLFLAAGGVIMNAHTRQIDLLGGRAKVMPWTAGAFLVGAVAICGLPPLNGFVSEFLVYVGMMGSFIGLAPTGFAVLALGAPALALVGALAVACFVKVYGAVFLGLPRSHVPLGREPAPEMVRPMVVLAVLCVGIGVLPAVALGVLTPAVATVTGSEAGAVQEALMPARALGVWTPAVAGGLVVMVAAAYLALRRRPVGTTGTWDCGYVRPTGRMQYTSSSFAASILELFRWVLKPHETKVRLMQLFPRTVEFGSHVGDVVLDRMLLPFWRGVKTVVSERRARQQGIIQWYIIYICMALAVLLLSLMPWQQWWNWMLAQG